MHRPLSSRAFFNLRRPSLLRGSLVVLGSLAFAIRISDFPNSRATLYLAIPALLAAIGTIDTVRCMHSRWDLYHGGVLLCIYMDLMAILLIFFFLLSPYLL